MGGNEILILSQSEEKSELIETEKEQLLYPVQRMWSGAAKRMRRVDR